MASYVQKDEDVSINALYSGKNNSSTIDYTSSEFFLDSKRTNQLITGDAEKSRSSIKGNLKGMLRWNKQSMGTKRFSLRSKAPAAAEVVQETEDEVMEIEMPYAKQVENPMFQEVEEVEEVEEVQVEQEVEVVAEEVVEEEEEEEEDATLSFLHKLESLRSSFPESSLGAALSPSLFLSYSPEEREKLMEVTRAGIHFPDAPMGLFMSDAEDYNTLSDVVVPLLSESHGVDRAILDGEGTEANCVQQTSLDGWDLQGEKLQFSRAIPSLRLRASRNLNGLPLVAGMDQADRMYLERMVWAVVKQVARDHPLGDMFEGGMCYSLTPMSMYDGKLRENEILGLKFIDEKEREQMCAQGNLMVPDMEEDPLLVEAGLTANGQVGTGCFVSRDGSFCVMYGVEDHLKFVVRESDAQSLSPLVDQLCTALNVFQDGLLSTHEYVSHSKWGFVTSDPSKMGTGLHLSARLSLPSLFSTDGASDRRGEVTQMVQDSGMEMRNIRGKHENPMRVERENMVDVTPKGSLMVKERESAFTLFFGVEELLKREEEAQREREEAEEDPTLSYLNKLESLRSSFPESSLGASLSPSLFLSYSPEERERLMEVTRAGIQFPDAPSGGVFMSNADDYNTLSDVVVPLLSESHGIERAILDGESSETECVQQTGLDGWDLQGEELKFSRTIPSLRLRASRNLTGLPLMAGMDRTDKLYLERMVWATIRGAAKTHPLADIFDGGVFYSLTPPEMFPQGVGTKEREGIEFITEKERAFMCDNGMLMVPDMEEDPLLVEAGLTGSVGAGCFVSRYGDFCVMYGVEDHLKFIVRERYAKSLSPLMEKLMIALSVFEDVLMTSHAYATHDKWGFVTSDPSKMGTGLHLSARLALPCLFGNGHLDDREEVQELIEDAGMEMRNIRGKHENALRVEEGAMLDVCSKGSLLVKERESALSLFYGVEELLKWEDRMSSFAMRQ